MLAVLVSRRAEVLLFDASECTNRRPGRRRPSRGSYDAAAGTAVIAAAASTADLCALPLGTVTADANICRKIAAGIVWELCIKRSMGGN